MQLCPATPWWNAGGGSECAAPLIRKLGTGWRWVVSLTLRPLYSGTHRIGGWVGPRAGLDVWKRKDSVAHVHTVHPCGGHLHRLCYRPCPFWCHAQAGRGLILVVCCAYLTEFGSLLGRSASRLVQRQQKDGCSLGAGGFGAVRGRTVRHRRTNACWAC